MKTLPGCCAPSVPRDAGTDSAAVVRDRALAPHAPREDKMIRLSGGSFSMGTDSSGGFPADGEGPVHEVKLSPYFIDACTVTNDEFARFVANTQYRTDAERYGWSFVFHMALPDDFPPTRAIACAPWWRQVEGADWKHPEGPHSSIDGRLDHPVVHTSWNDACAFAQWAQKRLPTEAEWEFAARGGLQQALYPWGDELMPGGEHRCNIWQGTFPTRNSSDDGYVGTAPAHSYAPNGFGLYNTAGNVWEWCADWFSPVAYRHADPVDPRGPARGDHRVIRGGSYLCHDSYCNRYRVAARSHNEPASSTGNMGFRCARDQGPGI